MCDTIRKEKLTKEEIPQYVYKRVQKVGNGKYVTPVMGEPLYKGSWKGAKKVPKPNNAVDVRYTPLVRLLQTKFKKVTYPKSSEWASHHSGRWSCFANEYDAKGSGMVSNFMPEYPLNSYPTIVVRCEIRGNVSSSKYCGYPTYLASQIRVVEELGRVVN